MYPTEILSDISAGEAGYSCCCILKLILVMESISTFIGFYLGELINQIRYYQDWLMLNTSKTIMNNYNSLCRVEFIKWG